jgi:hypothetical protein
MSATSPTVDTELANLKAELEAGKQELEQEVIDLSDTITQWQARALLAAEHMKRRKGD